MEQTPDTTIKRFEITWDYNRTGYCVSIPGYEGGEVVTAEAYDALRDAARFALSVLKANPVEMSERMAIEKLETALVDVQTTDEGSNE